MPLRDDLLDPIPGPSPGGISLRYDPVTDQIKEARREELEVPQGDWKTTVKTADYALAIKLAGEALVKKGKDLQIAVWLIDSLVRKDGLNVLPSALQFLYDLCSQYWDTLNPEIEDGDVEVRAAPLDWLGSKLEGPIRMLPLLQGGKSWIAYKESRLVGYESNQDSGEKQQARLNLIAEGKLSAEEFDAWVDETPRDALLAARKTFQDALTVLADLTAFLDEKFGDYSPSFLKVRAAIEDDLQVLKALIATKPGVVESDPVPQPPTVNSPSEDLTVASVSVARALPPAAGSIAVSTNAPLAAGDAATQVALIARSLRSQDQHNVSAYLVLRAFWWGEIRSGGMAIDKRMLVAPPPATRQALESFYAAEQWDQLLHLTEQTMETPAGRGWLDLQRYAVKALEGKGQWFATVADAVRTSVRGLLQDLPGLLKLSLRDGSPTADEKTRKWIETEVFTRADAPPDFETDALSEQGDGTLFQQALSACRNGRLTEALGILNRDQLAERSGRGRFRRRVQIGHILVEAERKDLAKPILEELVNDIEKRHLEDWEYPEAVAYPISLLYRCVENDPEMRQRLYVTICKLDPRRAATLPVSSS